MVRELAGTEQRPGVPNSQPMCRVAFSGKSVTQANVLVPDATTCPRLLEELLWNRLFFASACRDRGRLVLEVSVWRLAPPSWPVRERGFVVVPLQLLPEPDGWKACPVDVPSSPEAEAGPVNKGFWGMPFLRGNNEEPQPHCPCLCLGRVLPPISVSSSVAGSSGTLRISERSPRSPARP